MTLNDAKRIVIKVGSSLLVEESGALKAAWLAAFAADACALKARGVEIIIVTSGAVALGRRALGLATKTLLLEEKQAAAACGQIALAGAWRDAFAAHQTPAAQVLLTNDDSQYRRRYLNARATLETLLSLGAIPIINENDTVATAELRVGDNDRLSARVAEMVSAEVLILFSDIDGLYTANPRTHKNAAFIPEVRGGITAEIEAYAGGAGSSVGTGGMATKLQAARIALAAGCDMLIARGEPQHALKTLLEAGKHTRFVADESPLSARKRWISGMLSTAGVVVVDAGAEAALQAGKSLLPAGVSAVKGEFERGDIVLIQAANGRMIGKGITAYSSADAERIRGRKTGEVESILGFKGRSALIHRDDMTLEG